MNNVPGMLVGDAADVTLHVDYTAQATRVGEYVLPPALYSSWGSMAVTLLTQHVGPGVFADRINADLQRAGYSHTVAVQRVSVRPFVEDRDDETDTVYGTVVVELRVVCTRNVLPLPLLVLGGITAAILSPVAMDSLEGIFGAVRLAIARVTLGTVKLIAGAAETAKDIAAGAGDAVGGALGGAIESAQDAFIGALSPRTLIVGAVVSVVAVAGLYVAWKKGLL